MTTKTVTEESVIAALGMDTEHAWSWLRLRRHLELTPDEADELLGPVLVRLGMTGRVAYSERNGVYFLVERTNAVSEQAVVEALAGNKAWTWAQLCTHLKLPTTPRGPTIPEYTQLDMLLAQLCDRKVLGYNAVSRTYFLLRHATTVDPSPSGTVAAEKTDAEIDAEILASSPTTAGGIAARIRVTEGRVYARMLELLADGKLNWSKMAGEATLWYSGYTRAAYAPAVRPDELGCDSADVLDVKRKVEAFDAIEALILGESSDAARVLANITRELLRVRAQRDAGKAGTE